MPPIIILALFANTAESRILALAVNAQEPAATAPLLDNVLGQESIDALKKRLEAVFSLQRNSPRHLTHSDPGQR